MLVSPVKNPLFKLPISDLPSVNTGIFGKVYSFLLEIDFETVDAPANCSQLAAIAELGL